MMKVKKFTVEDIYFKMIEQELKENKVFNDECRLTYFSSYYINKFLHTDFKMRSYIGFRNKEQLKDVFIITIPFASIKTKGNRVIFMRYFEEGIRDNERYIGLLRTNKELGFIFKHDEELLNAYKTGQYSKISELKKSKMRKFKVVDYDIKVRAFYVVGKESNKDNWKNYPLGKRDLLTYQLYKMIYPEFFYNVLAEQFNVKIEYLKKNHVQILPKPKLENDYFELSENEEIYWFEKK